MHKFITDFENWLLDYGDRLYRYLVYKKMFTPYEQQQAFEDESVQAKMGCAWATYKEQ